MNILCVYHCKFCIHYLDISSSGLFSFLESIDFFFSKLFLYTFLVYYLAYLSYAKFLSNVRPFVLTNSTFSYICSLCICNIFSIASALFINSTGSSSSGFNFFIGFSKNLNISVTFSATKGIDHSNKSIKLGKKYGCGFYKNCWMSNVLF